MTRAWRAVRLALAFLTILPVPIRDDEVSPDRLADSRFAYPLVGALIGLMLAALSEGLQGIGARPGPSAFLLVAAGVMASGGLHLDGLADAADGLLPRGEPARRLAAMRDPHLGSFGVAAMVLVLLGKFAALEAMNGPGRSLALLGGATISRSLVLVSAGLAPYARPEGTGRFLVEATTRRDAALGSALALAVGLAAGGPVGLVASAVAALVSLTISRMALTTIGGVTGDTIGAAVELGDLAFLLLPCLVAGR
jgi:adenosylcobinamide-GDP ribazoletransferase